MTRNLHTPNFLIYVLVCTAQNTYSMKTNNIPLKSPTKWLPEFFEKNTDLALVAGMKEGPYTSTIPSFLVDLNEEALLKVSFKNIDWFHICLLSKTTAFSKKEFFLHFWWQFYRAFRCYIVCFHTLSGC